MRDETAIKLMGGAACGGAAALAWVWSGGSTYLHEVVGHIGSARLIHNYAPGRMPTWKVVQFDNFRALRQQPNWANLKRVLLSSGKDGYAGWAKVGGGTPNRLGLMMGGKMSSAFVSIGGSVPELVFDAALVEGSRHVDEKKAAGMWTFGIISHIAHSAYPMDAIYRFMSGAKAISGHDFINFAKKVGELTGHSPLGVSAVTGTLWLSSVPILGIRSAIEYAERHA